jgi:hypothetical protein
MAGKSCPVPGERSREWLQRAREQFTEFVNPMPAANLVPGRRPSPYEDAFDERKRMHSMESSLAKKWEKD